MSLKKKYVTFGWEGSEFEATEFTHDMATLGLYMMDTLKTNDVFYRDYLLDVIEEPGTTYILNPFWGQLTNYLLYLYKKCVKNGII